VPPPEVETAGPEELLVRLEAANPPDGVRRGQPPEYEQAAALSAEGEARLTLIPDTAPRDASAEGALRVPMEGNVVLTVVARRDGLLLGAGDGAVTITAAGGRRYTVDREPQVAVRQIFTRSRRLWLSGRDRLPRQVAVFRFADVPASAFGSGDVGIEIGTSLDAGAPATFEMTAQATFVKPGAEDARRIVRFTPEKHHPTLLYLDRSFWHGGPLEVRIECLTSEYFLGLLPESVRLRADGGPFAWNFAKALASVWCFGAILTAVGVALSTRMSWFVGILATGTFLLVAAARDFIRTQTPVGTLARQAARWLRERADWADWDAVVERVVPPLPNLLGMLPGEDVAMGQALALTTLGATVAWTLVAAVVLVALGTLLLRSREIAA
jgi:hypothetical protein